MDAPLTLVYPMPPGIERFRPTEGAKLVRRQARHLNAWRGLEDTLDVLHYEICYADAQDLLDRFMSHTVEGRRAATYKRHKNMDENIRYLSHSHLGWSAERYLCIGCEMFRPNIIMPYAGVVNYKEYCPEPHFIDEIFPTRFKHKYTKNSDGSYFINEIYPDRAMNRDTSWVETARLRYADSNAKVCPCCIIECPMCHGQNTVQIQEINGVCWGCVKATIFNPVILSNDDDETGDHKLGKRKAELV